MWKRKKNKECLDFAPGIGMMVRARTFSRTYGFFFFFCLRFLRALRRVVFLAKDGTRSGEALGVCRATLANPRVIGVIHRAIGKAGGAPCSDT